MGRSVVALAAAAVLAGAGLLPGCSCGREAPPPPRTAAGTRPWVCEKCGHTYTAPNARGVGKCPKCGEQAAIRMMVYECGQCATRFEAYRVLDCEGMESPMDPAGKPLEPGIYTKKKGGEWFQDEEMLGTIVCPKCQNDDPGKMKPSTGLPAAK